MRTINGHELDESQLATKFKQYYETGQRIEVATPYGETLRGYVGKTTGWRPSYLLLARVDSIGSSELLDDRYTITQTINRFRR